MAKSGSKNEAENSGKLTPAQEIEALLFARNTALWVVTEEERRVEREIAREARNSGWEVRYWDCSAGMQDINLAPVKGSDGAEVKKLPDVIRNIRERKVKTLYILRDADQFLKEPQAVRALKTLARDLEDEERTYEPELSPGVKARRSLLLGAFIILTGSGEIPPSLSSSVTVFHWDLPTKKEVQKIVSDSILTNGLKPLPPEQEEEIVNAALGLRADDVSDAILLSLAKTRNTGRLIELREVAAYKRRVVEKEGVLEWHDPDPRGLEAVGGLHRLKPWLEERRLAMTPAAREYGLPAPRGVLLAGLPGCGKTMVAKAVAAAWKIPLLRLDPGALKGRYVGQSEEQFRRALRTAEAVAPIILWIEEIEKALAGATGLGDSSGVSKDQLGQLLTWLQEHAGTVFLVATANDCSSLPPELLRKGRFDEVFFVDLPTRAERREIFAATARKYRRNPEGFDLEAVATATEKFSGAEVADAFEGALRAAFGDGSAPREPNTEDVISAASRIRPSSENQDRLKLYREWGMKHAVPASDPEEAVAAANGKGYPSRRVELD